MQTTIIVTAKCFATGIIGATMCCDNSPCEWYDV